MTRLLGNLILGFALGALTSELCGERAVDYVSQAARKVGSGTRKVIVAFRAGFAGEPVAEAEPKATPSKRSRKSS